MSTTSQATNDVPPAAQSSTAMAAPVAAAAVAAVSFKILSYGPNDPMVWFVQEDAQFITHNITAQETKYTYLIASLQPEVAQETHYLLITPPTNQPFDQLKVELINHTSASEQKRLRQLLIAEELGDRKPSPLLCRMRQLLADNCFADNILRQQLPQNVLLFLAYSPDTLSIGNLATLADRILEVATVPPSPSTELTNKCLNCVA